jgi:uncharacterized protein (DUF1684 family)
MPVRSITATWRTPLATALLPVLAGLLAVACSSGPSAPDGSAPLEEIADWREARNELFAEDASIVPVERREALLPIPYYPPDLGYRVPAVLRLADRREVAEMPTSTGTLRRMERVGNLEFTLGGEMLTLGAFVEYGTQRIESLFVPFADLTTGEEAYDAGRYLDIEPTASGLYTIDFNYAYNPNCAYSDLYECPFPPPSNRLKVAIQAGEKAPGA